MEISETQIKQLLEAAMAARSNAYAPYSNFAVGAAVLTASGKVFTGCNVENSSYGLTVCAERVAVLKAVSEGERKIAAIAVVAPGVLPKPPCGACLQVISEFGGPETAVICATPEGERQIYALADLLPKPFRLLGG